MKNGSVENSVTAKRADGRKVLLLCLLVFAVVPVAAVIAAVINKIHPFGNETILFSDLIAEYTPFLCELHDKVHSGESLLYSWRAAAGGSFIGNFCYYLSSPMNLIVLLFKRDRIQDAITFLVVLRQSMAGAFMTYFLCRRKKGAVSFYSAVCGLLYAFSGWFLAYYYDIIWLDCFMLLPLLILGLERLIDDGGIKLFVPILIVMMFSNFYYSYIVSVFVVVYFFFYFLSNYSFAEYEGAGKKRTRKPFFKSLFWKRILLTALSGVFSVLVLSFILVPFVLQMAKNGQNDSMYALSQMFRNFAQQVSGLYSGHKTNSNAYAGYPNIYMGVLPLTVLPLFIASEKISKREKTAGIAAAVFFVLSFNLPFLDLIWHGFRYPNCYPFRQSLFFTFLALILTHEVLQDIESFKKKTVLTGVITSAALLLLFGTFTLFNDDVIRVLEGPDMLVTVLLFAVFCALIYIPKKSEKSKSICFALIFALSFADVTSTLSQNLMIKDNVLYDDPETHYSAIQKLVSKEDKDMFHRSELPRMWSMNDGSILNFNSVKSSSSTMDTSLLVLLRRLGLDSNLSNFVKYYPQTPAFNSLFGIKHLYVDDGKGAQYIASYREQTDEGYVYVGKEGGYEDYLYKYALPLGFAADTELEKWETAEHKAIENQNSFFTLASGCGDILTESDSDMVFIGSDDYSEFKEIEHGRYSYKVGAAPTSSDPTAVFEFTVKKDGPFYIYCDMDCDDDPTFEVKIIKKTNYAETFGTLRDTLTVCAYNADAGDKVYLWAYLDPLTEGEVTARAFQCSADEMKKAYDTLTSNGGYEITSFKTSHIDGTIDVKGDKKLFTTTIPYDKGWKITVDGETLPDKKIIRTGGALISFELVGGKHTVSFDFTPSGLYPGVVLSALTLAAGAAYVILKKKKEKSE
ncbi:MAG: YfhO family protein [Clostridiales bacterium]|nr:YfhO family protein [Clostridiales bacterium]